VPAAALGLSLAELPANPTRLDPYNNFKFRVKWDGQFIPRVDRVRALSRTSDAVTHREGGSPSQESHSPALAGYPPILL
jgi:phage tail-like protein